MKISVRRPSDKCAYCKHPRSCHVMKDGKQECHPLLAVAGVWCGCQRFVEPDPRNRPDYRQDKGE